ncbi:hypothetical protein PFISCL1PPCAC_21849 [Pristionchus fissidentatus]|uniref:TATA box-binding protein-like 1 n=1 Tax=Pristionchus fissidentatus TaxID=1538716 RepID=A0AAV5WL03_9BILA|nr:hypothetical protein PFISCL1PPCAC_21849 [Pristionchus fissidentatus]
MSFVYGGYKPKAPNGTAAGSSQGPATSATGRKFAVMPGKKLGLGLGGLGYSKPPPKPAAASQVPVAPAAASPTPSTDAAASPAAAPPTPSTSQLATQPATVPPRSTVVKKEEPPSPPPATSQQQVLQQQQQMRPRPQMPIQQQQSGYLTQHSYAAPRPPPGVRASGGARVLMPVARAAAPLGYAAQVRQQPMMVQQQQPVMMMRSTLGYGNGGGGYSSNLALDVPLHEPSPEPMPVVVAPVVKQEEYRIEDDYKVYGTVNDIEIQIRNVVCNYTLPLHIDLRRLAQNTNNVTFDRGRGVLMKQKRNPMCYVKIYSSGKVYIVGCRSEDDCMTAARRIARNVQRAMNKLGEEVRIRNYRVCNVLATCKMPFGVKIEDVAAAYPSESQYEPELSVGLVWRNKEPKATLRIHTTGSVTVTGAQSEADVFTVIERLYPILLKYKCPPRSKNDASDAARRKREAAAAARKRTQQFSSGYGAPRSKMSRVDSGVIGGRVVFSDEEDEDDIYDPALYGDE